MTNSEQPSELLEDAEVRRLLQSIAHDPGTTFPNRAELRERILAEVAMPNFIATPKPSGRPDIEIVGLHDRSGQPNASRVRWPRLAAAAALLIVIGTGVGLANRQDGDPETETAAVSQSQLVPSGTEFPLSLDAGAHRTEAIADGIRLDIPVGIEVLEEGPGVLVLGRSGDAAEPRARITIIESDSAEPLEVLIERLEAEGLVRPIQSMTVANQGFTSDWELRVTNEGSSEFGCVDAGPCVPFGSTELWSRGVNYASEISGPEGQTVWWVEQSSVYQDPLLDDATAILASLQFD